MRDMIIYDILKTWKRQVKVEISKARLSGGAYECGRVDMLEECITELKQSIEKEDCNHEST